MSVKFKNALVLAQPLYWPFWLLLGLFWCITRLPFNLQMKIGIWLGNFLHRFSKRLKKITTVNIQLCFPQLSASEQEELIRKNFQSVGIGIIEMGLAWWLPQKKLEGLFELKGLEHGLNALEKGKGVILLSPHFTCLEIIGRLLGTKYSFASLYRPHKKPLIRFIHEHFRQKYQVRTIPRHRLRELLRVLNENSPVWYAYDIDAGEKNSIFAPFFNIQTASITAVSRIAQMSGAAVVPVSFYRKGSSFQYEVFLHPALENFPSDDLVADVTRLNAIIEKAIRYKPEQYIWQYKRFKTRPAGEARFY